MTIFTFMGANVLRQDDSYSFEIIKKTIEAVIPTLVTVRRHSFFLTCLIFIGSIKLQTVVVKPSDVSLDL